MSWLGDIIIEMVQLWVNEVLNVVYGLVDDLFSKANTVIGLSEVNAVLAVTNTIATTFLVLIMMKQLFTIHILETDGDPDQDPLKILEKGCIALAVIQLQNYLLTNAINLASEISNKVLGVIEVSYGSVQEIIDLVTKLFGTSVIVTVILMIAYVIGFIMFLWKGLKRCGELAFMKMLFPFFVCDMATVSVERFRAFFSSYMTVIFGYIVQMILYKLSMVMMFGSGDFLLSLVFIFLASSAPKWLEKYIYSTGAARGATNVARSAMYMVPQFIRMVK